MHVNIDGSLEVKRRTLVITNYNSNSNSKDNHDSGANDLEIEVEPAEVPTTLEDWGQATVDELKELCPIYVTEP